MNYKAMFGKAKEVHKRCKKPTLFILTDMIWCGFKYGAGYMDYTVLEFYLMNSAQRDTFMTRGRSNTLVKAMNKREDWHYLEDKREFLRLFADSLNREWADLEAVSAEEFAEFCRGKNKIMAKVIDGDGGKGVDMVEITPQTDCTALYSELKDKKQTLVEDYIIQHPDIMNIYAGSVNTLRIVTVINKQGEADITRCLIRIGAGGAVDNISSGGMAALVDEKTGEIIKPAHDKTGATHTVHPITGAPIVGVKIPMWNEITEMTKKAALKLPTLRYCAWDVAVTENGPVFIEGNQYPGHEIQQLPPHVNNRTGMWVVYKQYLEGKR